MITQGIEHDIILDRVRESAGSNRMSFLEKKDIDNICVRYGLNKTHSRHSDDSTSVRLIVKEMQDANEVMYFKDQGDVDSDNPEIPSKEFVLGFMKGGQELIFSTQMKSCDKIQVCMDSTHCISQYSGFQLTTLMILTDLNKGFPVAFLISSSVNTSILKAFLNSVKKRMGQVRAYTFMSDDDPVFRNAWDATMGRDMNLPVKYINCSWHTDRSFRKNIASKISAPFMEKLSVYQMVRVLMDEQEENEFHKQCKGFLSYLLEAGFERFHDYFKENYLCENRIQLWPQCYREGAILNTNNHLESMHRLLKYVYLKGKKVKRLDYTILALNKMVKEKLFKRMVDLMKKRTGKPFRERHEKGMKLEVTQEDHGLFTVSSESFENKLYEIQTNNPTCEVCRERCPDCHVCKCMYVCTCDDNAKGMKNICKHIHAVAEFLRNKSQIAKPKLPTEEIEKIHDVVSNEEIAKPKVSTEEINMIHDVSNEETYDRQVVKYQEQLKNKIMLQLLPKCSESKDLQVLKTANSLLCKLIATLDAGTSYPPNNSNWPVDVTTVSEPGNKKCVKQDRLYSTRKRKRENIGMCLKKPSSKARLIIGESLAKSESDVSVPVLSEGRIDDEHSY